jgi:hypothetical protein
LLCFIWVFNRDKKLWYAFNFFHCAASIG